MQRFKRFHKIIALSLFVAFLAVACSGRSEPSEPAQPASSQSTGQEADAPAGEGAVEQPAEDQPPTEGATDATDDEGGAAVAGPVGELDLSWNLVQIGEGIKPAFGLDAAGNAHITYLTEEEVGGLFYATNASGDFDVENVASGYFYGPIDISIGPDGTPYIAYHDHQDIGFDPNLGDEVVAIQRDGSWELITIEDTGHDGWDNSIVVDADGNWHTAAIDPAQFGSQDGVEYATNAGGSISVTQVGSGPIFYEFATSIQLDDEGLPGIAYYDQDEKGLEYAKFDGDEWTVELIDNSGDAGRYANLIYDADGNAHITYFVVEDETTGVLRHAWWDGSSWQIEEVDRLDDFRQGSVGARKNSALAFDDDGDLHIAYSDRSRVVYGRRSDEGWLVQELPKNSDKILGQLVELELDGDGNPHLVWYEVTVFAPTLTGDIIYASGT